MLTSTKLRHANNASWLFEIRKTELKNCVKVVHILGWWTVERPKRSSVGRRSDIRIQDGWKAIIVR